jgi:hypothetical protein
MGLVHGKAGLAAPRVGRGGRRPARPPRRPGHRLDGDVHLARQPGYRLQGPDIADAGEQDLGAEQGEEPVGRLPAPSAGLGQVLQAGEC